MRTLTVKAFTVSTLAFGLSTLALAPANAVEQEIITTLSYSSSAGIVPNAA